MSEKMPIETARREIKSVMKLNKILIGNNRVIKDFKTGRLEAVICASNCPEGIKRDIGHYAKISKTKVHEMDGNSVKLGELCGKPFNVIIVGIKK